MRKGVMTSSRLINDRLASDSVRWVPLMVTLTYRNAEDWRPEHVTDFIRRVQAYARRRGQVLPYVWVMELQKRGAPHYHVLLWVPRRWRLPKSDRRGWWVHGSTNTVRVRNAVGYVAKYASKGLDTAAAEFPKGARIHGIGGLTRLEARIVAWWKLPSAWRTGEEGSSYWRRVPGGGWRCLEGAEAGRFVAPLWGLSSVDTERKRVRLVQLPGGCPSDVRRSSLRGGAYDDVKLRWFEESQRSSALFERDRAIWLARVEAAERSNLSGVASPSGYAPRGRTYLYRGVLLPLSATREALAVSS